MKVLDDFDKEEEDDIEVKIAKEIAINEYYFKVQITGKSLVLKRLNQTKHLGDIFDLDARRFGLKGD